MAHKDLKVHLVVPPTKESLLAVYLGYRTCYSKFGYDRLIEEFNSKTEDEVVEYITKMLSSNHVSPGDHMHITFAIEGISRDTTLQIIRHRIGVVPDFNPNPSQQSQRYVGVNVEEGDIGYIIPRKALNSPKAMKLIEEAFATEYQYFINICDALVETHGGERKDYYEVARSIVGGGVETRVVLTASFTAWNHLFKLRSCIRAQDEVRIMTMRMHQLLHKAMPGLFKLGRACNQTGVCHESTQFSCGDHPTMDQLLQHWNETHKNK